MRGLYSHSRKYRKIFSGDILRILSKFLRELISVEIHVAPVFAPARIQENIPGEPQPERKQFIWLERDWSEPIFGQGIRRSAFQWKKRVFSEKGGGIQWIRGLVKISTGKAIQWRGPGDSVNRRIPKIEKLLSKSTSQKSAPKTEIEFSLIPKWLKETQKWLPWEIRLLLNLFLGEGANPEWVSFESN